MSVVGEFQINFLNESKVSIHKSKFLMIQTIIQAISNKKFKFTLNISIKREIFDKIYFQIKLVGNFAFKKQQL